MQRGLDNIIHDVALQNLPVVMILDRAGLVGEDGGTHHGVFDLSYLKAIPNLTIMSPLTKMNFRIC
jgi:1-deoxy-D-xylulose-5-phosphate synthase